MVETRESNGKVAEALGSTSLELAALKDILLDQALEAAVTKPN